MRIAMLGPFPEEPDGPLSGGVETVMTVLLPALAEMPDVTVDVISCRSRFRQRATARWGAITVHRLPRHRMGHVTFYKRDRREMQRLLHELSPDVVHAQGSGMYAGVAIESGRPAVITVHGVISREAALAPRNWPGLQQRLAGLYERQCLRRARHVIAISPYVEEECRAWSSAQMHAVENPIADRFFAEAEPPPTDRVLFVGLIRPRKRLEDLLNAWRTVIAGRPYARLRIVGDTAIAPAYAAALRAQVRADELADSVDFVGPLPSEALLPEYRACSLLVLPSAQETAPMVIEEVMATGRPVVATRVGGVPFLVDHRRTGLLTDVGDTDGMAQAICQLLEDDAGRERMGREARRQAEARFRARAVAQRTRRVYETLM